MVSTLTTNKKIEKPASGDYPNAWAAPINTDWDIIDQAFGSTTGLNATNGSATLTAAQYRSLFLNISEIISAPVTYTIPSGIGGQWIVYNSTTDSSGGPHAITIVSGGAGTSVVVPRLARIVVVSDGTNIATLGYLTSNSTNTGFLTMSGAITAGTTIAAGTTVTAGTNSLDSIGNLREVPANSQTGAYVLVATDSGKYISITTGGVTVPSGIFTVGQTITIYNNSTANQTITQGASVTLRFAGTATTGNRTLSQYGLATMICVASNVFAITGVGLS
jgi:hypothetical protein